ncbi:MAG: hypothetical protein HYX36_01540 [Rhizobiales bacterium]|nr:hypothetical protein [Hyphomicrobiales bacterium]
MHCSGGSHLLPQVATPAGLRRDPGAPSKTLWAEVLETKRRLDICFVTLIDVHATSEPVEGEAIRAARDAVTWLLRNATELAVLVNNYQRQQLTQALETLDDDDQNSAEATVLREQLTALHHPVRVIIDRVEPTVHGGIYL